MRKILVRAAAAVVVMLATATLMVVWAQQSDVPPSQVAIGGKTANVKLAKLSGEGVQLYDYAGQHGTLVLFVSTRCPISKDYDQRMAEIAREYTGRGFTVIGINSNRTEPPEEVAQHANERLGFTVLKDAENRVADYLGASFTPEAYLFDHDWTLRYHGRIDDSRNTEKITVRDLHAALDALATGKAVPVAETKAFGCTIKRVPRTP